MTTISRYFLLYIHTYIIVFLRKRVFIEVYKKNRCSDSRIMRVLKCLLHLKGRCSNASLFRFLLIKYKRKTGFHKEDYSAPSHEHELFLFLIYAIIKEIE